MTLVMETPQGTIEVKAKAKSKILEVKSDRVVVEGSVVEQTVSINGQVMSEEIPPPSTAEIGFMNEPLMVSSVESAIDVPRASLIGAFIAKSQTYKPGDTFEVKTAAIPKYEIPALISTGKFIGMEKVGDEELGKFEAKVAEVGGEEFVSEGTYWVRPDGTVVKAKSKFRNLPFPMAATSLAGTSESELVSIE